MPKSAHKANKLWANVTPCNRDRPAAAEQLHSKSEYGSVISADDCAIVRERCKVKSVEEFNVASGFGPFEMRDAPLGSADDGLWAAEANGEVERGHFVGSLEVRHASGKRPSKSIDILPRITHSNNSMLTKSVEHGVVNWREVLRLIDEDEGKLRVCSAEQCGHVYLIIVVDGAVVGSFDRSSKNCVNKVRDEVVWGFFERSMEC